MCKPACARRLEPAGDAERARSSSPPSAYVAHPRERRAVHWIEVDRREVHLVGRLDPSRTTGPSRSPPAGPCAAGSPARRRRIARARRRPASLPRAPLSAPPRARGVDRKPAVDAVGKARMTKGRSAPQAAGPARPPRSSERLELGDAPARPQRLVQVAELQPGRRRAARVPRRHAPPGPRAPPTRRPGTVRRERRRSGDRRGRPLARGPHRHRRHVGLTLHRLRRHVVAQPHEDRVAQVAFVGPVREPDVDHQLGAHPVGPLVGRRFAQERAVGHLACREQRLEAREILLAEAAADVAAYAQPAGCVSRHPEQQRTETRAARAARLGEAADHELLPLSAASLAPVARPLAGPVGAATILHYEPSHPSPRDLAEQLPPRRRRTERRSGRRLRHRGERRLEPRPPRGRAAAAESSSPSRRMSKTTSAIGAVAARCRCRGRVRWMRS